MPCLILFFSFIQRVEGQDKEITAGIRLQKTHNLYFENGITADFTSSKLWDQRLHLGVSYVTSRLGTALGSNAIKQDNYLATIQYNFRRTKIINPIVRLNGGFFHANLESAVFDELPHNSALFSIEGGMYLRLKLPVRPSLTFGYNLITGDGLSGPGTLFPLFYQLSISYKIL